MTPHPLTLAIVQHGPVSHEDSWDGLRLYRCGCEDRRPYDGWKLCGYHAGYDAAIRDVAHQAMLDEGITS